MVDWLIHLLVWRIGLNFKSWFFSLIIFSFSFSAKCLEKSSQVGNPKRKSKLSSQKSCNYLVLGSHGQSASLHAFLVFFASLPCSYFSQTYLSKWLSRRLWRNLQLLVRVKWAAQDLIFPVLTPKTTKFNGVILPIPVLPGSFLDLHSLRARADGAFQMLQNLGWIIFNCLN